MFVLNEFDAKSGFNKLYPIELMIRSFSSKCPNAFHLLLAACCRESHCPIKHSRCFEGPYDKALESLNDKLKEEAAAAKQIEDLKANESQNLELVKRVNQLEKEIADLRAYKKSNEAHEEEEEQIHQDPTSPEEMRGHGRYLPPIKVHNFVLCFGCKPSSVVKGDTTMVEDVKEAIL